MKKQFLVLGLGKFGKSVLKELSTLGHEVVGCDKDPKILEDNELRKYADHLVEGDAASNNVLEELDATQYDAVIVSMGDDFESAILIVLALKEMGCQHIYAKANDAKRGTGLQKAGASKVIFPEEETGKRAAHYIANPQLLHYVQLTEHFSTIELPIPLSFVGQSLLELNFRKNYNALVIMIRKEYEKKPIISPNPLYEFQPGDSIFVLGEDKDLERLRKRFE